ncbi:MAG TPA: cupin domain-containing protein [Actinomycetota bacterium]|nr:cupin domain-containing protein [Actinomycetota bacterium]
MGAGGTLSPSGGRIERLPGFEGHYVEVDGTTIGMESMDEAADFTPLYRGLPDDRCQCHHWGYVIEGRLILHRPEGDLTVEAGEAYYVGPGHTAETGLPGTRLVEFSPTDEHRDTMAGLARNLEGT